MNELLERTTIAFAFTSDLSPAQMKELLDASGETTWMFGDSEWYGDYLGGSLTAHAVARIYPEKNPGRFHVELRFVSAAGERQAKSLFLAAQEKLLKQVLPTIYARSLAPAEPLE